MNVNWNYRGLVSGESFVPKLPQSAWCFDPGEVLNRVGKAYSDRFDAAECRVVNVQHKPRRSLDLVYEFTDANRGQHVANLRFVPHGRFSEASAKALAGSPTCERFRLLDRWNALAWLLPADPGMPVLGDMFPAGNEAPPSFECLPANIAARFKAASVTWSLLSYRASDRVAIRIRTGDESADIVAKMHVSAGAAHRKLSWLWRSSRARDWMPQPIAADEIRNIRWETFIIGSSFEEKVAEAGLDDVVAEAAAALVELHQSKLDGTSGDDAADTHRRLVDVVLKRIDRARLPIGPVCHRLAAELGRHCPEPNGNPATIHGDLHTGNIVFVDNRAIFIDLDGVRRGDPVFDLALLGSRLLLIALTKERPDIQPIAKVLDALPEMYERQGGVPVDRSRFAWFLAALLVTRQIKTCITNAAPNIVDITNALGEAADSLLKSERLAH